MRSKIKEKKLNAREKNVNYKFDPSSLWSVNSHEKVENDGLVILKLKNNFLYE